MHMCTYSQNGILHNEQQLQCVLSGYFALEGQMLKKLLAYLRPSYMAFA